MRFRVVELILLFFVMEICDADVILHAFNWRYSDIEKNVNIIESAGYKKILVSPPLKSSGEQWWARYQPQDIRVIDNPLGNKVDLQKLINVMKEHDIEVYADVVLNHMANEGNLRTDLNYPGSFLLEEYSRNQDYYESQKLFGDLSDNIFSIEDFHMAFCITDWRNIYEIQNGRLCGPPPDTGLPDLSPTGNVILQQQKYLRALKQMGISGFRVDAVKHMDSAQINAIFSKEIIKDMHIFGEVITGGGVGDFDYDAFLIPYLHETNHGAYDFPLFMSIRAAFSHSGNMSLLVDPLARGKALPNDRAITFVMTHDIPNNDEFRHQIMDEKDELLAYSYILGRDGGSPMVYSDQGETKEKDGPRWFNFFRNNEIQAMIRFHNQVRGTTMEVISSDHCYILFKRNYASGDAKGLVGINKCDFPQEISFNTDTYKMFWNRDYQDVLDSSNIIKIDSNVFRVVIPAKNYRMWLLK